MRSLVVNESLFGSTHGVVKVISRREVSPARLDLPGRVSR